MNYTSNFLAVGARLSPAAARPIAPGLEQFPEPPDTTGCCGWGQPRSGTAYDQVLD